MVGNCLQSAIVYKATVSCNNEEKFYIGSTEQTFKKKCQPYACGAQRCDVCLSEKLYILSAGAGCINQNTELMQKCRHSNKFKLISVGITRMDMIDVPSYP